MCLSGFILPAIVQPPFSTGLFSHQETLLISNDSYANKGLGEPSETVPYGADPILKHCSLPSLQRCGRNKNAQRQHCDPCHTEQVNMLHSCDQIFPGHPMGTWCVLCVCTCVSNYFLELNWNVLFFKKQNMFKFVGGEGVGVGNIF